MTVQFRALNMFDRSSWPEYVAQKTAPPPSKKDDERWPDWLRATHVPLEIDEALGTAFATTHAENTGDERNWVALDRPSGFGKSSAAYRWATRYTAQVHDHLGKYTDAGQERIPVVHMLADDSMKGAALNAAPLHFMGVPPRIGQQQRAFQLMEQIAKHEVAALLMEEGHMLRTVGTFVVADAVRKMQHIPVTFMILGINLDASALLQRLPGEAGQAADQLHDRRCLVPGSPADWDEAERRRVFMSTVAAFERVYLTKPGARAPFLEDQALLKDLCKATDGSPGGALKCLKRAGAVAYANGGHLTPELIRAYWPRSREPRAA